MQEEASEGDKAGDAEEVKALVSDNQTETAVAEKAGSRALPEPKGPDTAGSGATGEAVQHSATGDAAGMEFPHLKAQSSHRK